MEDGRLPPLNHVGGSAEPSDEAAGKTHCEASVLNGDCGTPEDIMVDTPGNHDGAENASLEPDAKSELPRRSSIIKVNHFSSALVLGMQSVHMYTERTGGGGCGGFHILNDLLSAPRPVSGSPEAHLVQYLEIVLTVNSPSRVYYSVDVQRGRM